MNKFCKLVLVLVLTVAPSLWERAGGEASLYAQSRRPVDSQHPLWLVHVDVWNQADPQKIINLIPDDIKPYVCMNLSLSCQYDTEQNVYKMPQNAVLTYKSWATICQQNKMWFTCQPASGGHTHIQDSDLETFEYFFKNYPNFLGWNYAEQFWGFDETGDKSSSTQASRIALFAKLVPMAHQYGGMLIISFCGNIWSHGLNPVGMMKRNNSLLNACKQYPDAILWLFKYTTSSCWYNNESVTWGPFVAGLAKNYGVRYDNCGYNGALDVILGENHGKKYPVSAGIGTIMEQTCQNGGAVWDGPELIWTEDFQNLSNSTNASTGYTQRNWGTFPGFRNIWIDMFRKIIDGTMYIPTQQEVIDKTKFILINNQTSGSDEDKYATWNDLYDKLYKQTDPFNKNNGYFMDNLCYFKSTGRYGAIPMTPCLTEMSQGISSKIYKTSHAAAWPNTTLKKAKFDVAYPQVSTGDLFVSRYKNQLVTYTPYTYVNNKKSATANVPLKYNTCKSLDLTWNELSAAIIREYADSITFYMNNYRCDTTTAKVDKIVINGATAKPSYTLKKRQEAIATATDSWEESTGTYTLSLSHNGPVDIVIYCQGAETSRSTDILPSSPLEMPQQPEEYNGAIIKEAEDMDFKNIKTCCVNPYYSYNSVRGHAGNGFMVMGTNTSGALRTVIKQNITCKDTVTLRYTSTTSDKTTGQIRIQINGVNKLLSLPKTAVNEWKTVSYVKDMKAGDNTVVIVNQTGRDIYIDQMTFTPDAGATAIKEIRNEQSTINNEQSVNANAKANAIYNLNGIRVNENYKGIVIVNGKKIVK